MDKRDPKALFQQQIPRSYIDLQTLILETAQGLMQKGRPPIMEEEEFYRNFQHNFDDVDELKEAVNFLSLQGRGRNTLFISFNGEVLSPI